MPYPDRLLAEDEQVVCHLHPHWLTLVRPVVLGLLVVGTSSFAAAVVPPGPQQGVSRLAVVGVALGLLLVLVAVPLVRWRSTHYVLTTDRLLLREGVLVRRGRDLRLSRITDVSYSQTLWERVVRSGTLHVETAGDGGTTVLRRIPGSDEVQRLIDELIDQDAGRWQHQDPGPAQEDDGWPPVDTARTTPVR